jgi:F-type H+-transporting ATPase subunit b
MLLDPFTVGAQIVNFLILIWLLRRVLYGPVTRAMDAREARLRDEREEARRLRDEAQAERERLQQQVADFAAEQEGRMAAARAELERWREAQMDTARLEIQARRERWQHALAQEQAGAVREVRQRVAHEILSLTRQALVVLADSTLEERVIARFLDHLRVMTAGDRDRLLVAARDNGQRIHLRTALTLSVEERARLVDAVNQALGVQLTADVEPAPEIGSGIELRAGGFKVAWSLSDYLSSLEGRLATAFGDDSSFEGDADA